MFQLDSALSQNATALGALTATLAPAACLRTPALCASNSHPVGLAHAMRAAVAKTLRVAVAALSKSQNPKNKTPCPISRLSLSYVYASAKNRS